jgi:hypothetical protein
MRFRPFSLLLAALGLSLAFGAHAQAMIFETVTGPAECASRACILASGPVDEHTSRDFERFLESRKIARGGIVVLNSEGGNLMESLRLGNEIRSAGLATTVRDYDRTSDSFRDGGACASACAYAFLGGVERTVGKGGRIGVHQIYTAGDTWALSAQDGLEMMSLVAIHVRRMCGALDLLIPAMKTRPGDMHWLSQGELTRYAVVTSGDGRG